MTPSIVPASIAWEEALFAAYVEAGHPLVTVNNSYALTTPRWGIAEVADDAFLLYRINLAQEFATGYLPFLRNSRPNERFVLMHAPKGYADFQGSMSSAAYAIVEEIVWETQ